MLPVSGPVTRYWQQSIAYDGSEVEIATLAESLRREIE